MTKEEVLECVRKPDTIQKGYGDRKVYQKKFDSEHVLRVVAEESDKEIRIITVYSGRSKRYEAQV